MTHNSFQGTFKLHDFDVMPNSIVFIKTRTNFEFLRIIMKNSLNMYQHLSYNYKYGQNAAVNLLQIEYDDRAKATPLTKPVEKPKPKLPEEDGVDDVDIDAI